MIDVYSDEHQTALKYLKNTEANLSNVLIMARDFNIRNKEWDLAYFFHSTHSDSLLEITNSFDLKLSCPIQQILTRYSDNSNNTNSVINLLFLHPNSIEIDNHYILSKLHYFSDHTPLTIDIYIMEEFIQEILAFQTY